MKHSWVLCMGLVSLLVARENPFMPSSNNMSLEMIPATNQKDTRKEFEQRSTNLPSDARVLKYVTFGYQSLDGSIQEKKVMIDQKIDWHDPLILTKQEFLSPAKPILPAEPMLEEKAKMKKKPTTGIKETEVSMEVVSPPMSETPRIEPPRVEEKMAFSFQDFITFMAEDKKLVITTKDKNIRNFLLAEPYKVVLDFERDAAFYTKVIDVNHEVFKTITMGNHSGYYRAVVLLDGHYRYMLEKTKEGYILTLQ